MLVRQATLEDTQKIVRLFTARVPVWQRFDAQGRVEDLPYADLSVYDRWLHGGPWMSLETGAIWLSHLLGGNGLVYVGECDGEILAYAEAFKDQELAPLGAHLHLANLLIAESSPPELHSHLAEAILAEARGIGKISVAFPDYDKEMAAYYRRYYGTNEVFRLSRFALPAQIANLFYKSEAYREAAASKIEGWTMAVGRSSSPRSVWETVWTEHWQGVPKIIERSKHRFLLYVMGREVVLCFHQDLFNARNAEVYCWSPRELSAQLLAAIRDLGHKLGYRVLNLALTQNAARLLPPDANAEPNQQVIAAVKV